MFIFVIQIHNIIYALQLKQVTLIDRVKKSNATEHKWTGEVSLPRQ